jgi:hypothetical protein
MKPRSLVVLAIVSAALCGLLLQEGQPLARGQATQPVGLCVGVYDPRAIAIAYVNSNLFRAAMNEKQSEMKKATADNDRAKIKELRAWGEGGQIRLHLQGFAGAPVDDILAQVSDKLPEVAAAAGVDVITLKPIFAAPNVTTVDVTDRLVGLFTSDPQAIKTIAELRATKPLPIEEIATMPANQ